MLNFLRELSCRLSKDNIEELILKKKNCFFKKNAMPPNLLKCLKDYKLYFKSDSRNIFFLSFYLLGDFND